MTLLRDPFETVHKKEIKGKGGQVVARVDYVEWAAVAERLDAAQDVARWSFTIIQLGQDWCHGRLTIVDPEGHERYYENVGYAENAEADWKKEVLKDATSDALKRCAAMAGVARYLYEKDAQPAHSPPQRPQAPAPVRQASSGQPAPLRPSQPVQPPSVEPDWMADAMHQGTQSGTVPPAREFEQQHGVKVPVADNPPLGMKALFEAIEAKGLDRRYVSGVARQMYGTSMLKDLTDAQRGDLWAEVAA